MRTRCHSLLLLVLAASLLAASLEAQTATVIPDTEASRHVGQKATVEGVVVTVFTSNNGNTFINFGGKYPHQTFTGWIPKDSAPAIKQI